MSSYFQVHNSQEKGESWLKSKLLSIPAGKICMVPSTYHIQVFCKCQIFKVAKNFIMFGECMLRLSSNFTTKNTFTDLHICQQPKACWLFLELVSYRFEMKSMKSVLCPILQLGRKISWQVGWLVVLSVSAIQLASCHCWNIMSFVPSESKYGRAIVMDKAGKPCQLLIIAIIFYYCCCFLMYVCLAPSMANHITG